MVARDRGDTAPIVDAGRDQCSQRIRIEVRRRLDAHRRPKNETGSGNGPQHVSDGGLGRPRHARVRLGAKVLDDDLLDMAMAPVAVADGEQRLDALAAGLADADQDAGREGNGECSSGLDHLEARTRLLVRRTEMGPAGVAESFGCALQHQPLRGAHLPQALQLCRPHDPGIDVRQQAGFIEHELGRLGEQRERAHMPQRVELLAGEGVAQLRLIADCEQRLFTPRRRSGSRNVEDLVPGEICATDALRGSCEGAIGADVTAQSGQRDEDLARIGDD